jgi:hypothetical protein
MPIRLSTASGVFSKFIDEVFTSLQWHVVLTHIDDCLVYSDSFERLRDHGLTLGAEKCHLCTSSVRFLGHLVTPKIEAIKQMQMPTDKKGLWTTPGFFNYYRRFCKNYSSIAQPLNALLSDKESFCEMPLAHPDFTQPFIVDTDTCVHGLSAVLSQRSGDKVMPVAFASRSLTPADRAYTIWELETLAVY